MRSRHSASPIPMQRYFCRPSKHGGNPPTETPRPMIPRPCSCKSSIAPTPLH